MNKDVINIIKTTLLELDSETYVINNSNIDAFCNEIAKLNKPCVIKRYYFDSWNRTGRVKTRMIMAQNLKDAKLLFTAKYPDYAYDKPYTS